MPHNTSLLMTAKSLSYWITDDIIYEGGAAVRTQITENVFTANESPSSEKIPFHHEMSQVDNNTKQFSAMCISRLQSFC